MKEYKTELKDLIMSDGYILVLPCDIANDLRGLVIPSSVKTKELYKHGTISAVSPNSNLKTNDLVVYRAYSFGEYKIKDVTYYLLEEKHVVAHYPPQK